MGGGGYEAFHGTFPVELTPVKVFRESNEYHTAMKLAGLQPLGKVFAE